MPPLVSVVMPCFNAGRMLGPAVQSVLGQSYPNLEIIFVDNNSTDGSAEAAAAIAATAGRPFRLLHCVEQGPNHARIMGYAAASGDYIQWLDADDALGLEKIALQVQALEAHPGAAIAYCDWLASRHDPDGRRHDVPNHLGQVQDQLTRILCGIWYPPHAYLVRRAAADALHREAAWWPARTVGTDVEYSAIAAMLGQRFLHVPGARVQYNRWSAAQTSGPATPYASRLASLAAIYDRLARLARRPDVAPRIIARHRDLLAADWNVWTMPPGTAEIRTVSPRLVRLRHLASGRTIDARPREAAIAGLLMGSGLSQSIPHFALAAVAALPVLGNDIPFARAALERLRREGFLIRVDA